jgi:hypothetical protein
MANFSQTSGEYQVPQPMLEVLQKLIEAGKSAETINIATGIDTEQVRRLLANDSRQLERLVEAIKDKSRRFRCAQSNRLMVSPMMAADGNYYEQSILQAHPSISTEHVMLNPKLKKEIAEFSKDSLKALEGCLNQKEPQGDALYLAAECLSVLSLEADLESVLKVLGAVEGKGAKTLTEKLKDLVPGEYLLSLMNQTVRLLPYQTLCLAKLVILHPLNERAFEEAFRCFTEQLSQVSLSPGVVELADELSERLSSSQLGHLNSVLERQPREEGVEDKLQALRLKEAYLRLREGDVETAVSLVSILHISPRLEEELLKFYEEAGMPSAKLTILKHKLSASLEALRQDSPSVAATISIVYKLFDTQLSTLRTETVTQESFTSLRAEVGALRADVANGEDTARQATTNQEALIQELVNQSQSTGAATQKSFASLKAEVDVVHKAGTKARKEAKQAQTAQSAFVSKLEAQSKKTEAANLKSFADLRTALDAVHVTLTETRNEATSRMQRLKDQSEKRDIANQNSLKSLKDELERLKSELTEAQRLLQGTRELVDHLVETTRESVALSQRQESASSLNQEEYQTSPHVLSSRDAPDSAQYALSPSSDHQRLIESPPLASSIVSSLDTCEVCLRSQVDVELSCKHKCCQRCFVSYLSELDAVQGDTFQVKCFLPTCEEVIEEDNLKALLSEDQLLKLAPKSLLCKCNKGKLEAVDDKCLRCRVNDPEEIKVENRKLIAEMGGKACPRCGEGLFLEKGCHFVKCPSSTCETYFCWLCESVRALEEHYDHYPKGPFGSVCDGMQAAGKKENPAFECSCKSPSQWRFPCSDIICARCLRSFVLSQVNSHGFSVERFPCPKCSSVLPLDSLHRLFGDEYLFDTAMDLALLDASNLVASCEKCFLPSPTYVKLSCDHILCYNCMQAKIDQGHQSMNGREMKCPVSTCDTELSSADLSQFYPEHDVLRQEELRLKASQETKVWCPCCNNMNAIKRDSTSLTCCYCSKKCCLLCKQESREFHDCQIEADARCPKCARVLERNSCKYFYCSHCSSLGCRLCRHFISDLGEHFPSASGCINRRTLSVNSRPTTSVKAEFTCRCHKPAYTRLNSCDHSVCASCCQAYIIEQHSSPSFNIEAVGCPKCMTAIPSSVMLNLIFTSEADFKAKTRPMFECSICLVKSKVEDSITLDCEHRFCEGCIKDYISHLVRSDNVDSTKLVCPSDRCSQEISDTILHALLSQDVFDKLVEFRLRRLFDSCPSGCGYIADNDDRERLFNCEKCRAVYCRDCKERTTEQHRCKVKNPEETKGESRRLLAEMVGKACPRCGEGLFLENESNFVQCPSSTCLAYFCWLCEGVLTSGECFTHYPQGSFGSVCVGMQEADRKLNRTFESSMLTTSQSKTESSQISLEILARTEADKPRKSCPKCSFTKTKFGTANIQSCTKCQSYFCWLCEQALDYRQRLSHLDYRYSYCVGLQARDREKRASRLSHCACTAPVKLRLPCGHRSCKDCLLSSALPTSDTSQVKCSTCYAEVPRDLLRSLKEDEQRKTTAHLRGSNPAVFSNPYSKPCPSCQLPCYNLLNQMTVRCSCNKEFCWQCRTLFTHTTRQSDHFAKEKGVTKCKYLIGGRR